MPPKHRRKVKKKRPAVKPKSHVVLPDDIDEKTTSICHGTQPQAYQGCHIAHYTADWLLGAEDLDEDDFEGEIPDFAVDPDNKILTVLNSQDYVQSYFLTIPKFLCVGRLGVLAQGLNRATAQEPPSLCTTFVLLLEPHRSVDLCQIKITNREMSQFDLYSDITRWEPALAGPLPDNLPVYLFPLIGPKFQCTQAMGGQFTHFYKATWHAVDLACPVGTPVLAVAAGSVFKVQQHNTASGIHARNLHLWNSLMLKLDDGNFVEYVHLDTGSVELQEGERVAPGQVVGRSGAVGFCPQPHLHIQAHASSEDSAPTIPFAFRSPAGTVFPPLQVSKWYNAEGPA